MTAGDPEPGPGKKEPRAPHSRRVGRVIRRRPVTIATIAVLGLIIAITIINGTPGAPGTSARWIYTTGDAISGQVVSGGTVYAGSGDKVYALDAATGHLRWTYTTGGRISGPPVSGGGTVYVGSSNHKVYALDARS